MVNIISIQPGQIRLTGPVLADIYLGKITSGNDAAITALNPGVPCPKPSLRRWRADGSGTTFIFTNHLSKVSESWKSSVGEGTAVKWPVGTGGKGNEGVAAFCAAPAQLDRLRRVRLRQAEQDDLRQLQEQRRRLVQPSDDAFKAAAAGADWNKTFYQITTNQPGKDAWPIANPTFIPMHKVQDKPANASAALQVLRVGLRQRRQDGDELDYVRPAVPPWWNQSKQTGPRTQIKDAAGKPVAFAGANPPSPGSRPTAAILPTADDSPTFTNAPEQRNLWPRRPASPQFGPWADAVFAALAQGALVDPGADGGIIGLGDGASPAIQAHGLVLPVVGRMGPGAGEVWRPGDDLRHPGQLADCAADRRAGELWHRDVPDRAVAEPAAPAAGHAIELLAAVPPSSTACGACWCSGPSWLSYVQQPLPRADRRAGAGQPGSGPPVGIGILSAGIILAIMIIPFIASVMRDVFEVTPPMLKESAYGAGATTWEVVSKIVLPFTKTGVVGGIMLGLGAPWRDHGRDLRDRQYEPARRYRSVPGRQQHHLGPGQ